MPTIGPLLIQDPHRETTSPVWCYFEGDDIHKKWRLYLMPATNKGQVTPIFPGYFSRDYLNRRYPAMKSFVLTSKEDFLVYLDPSNVLEINKDFLSYSTRNKETSPYRLTFDPITHQFHSNSLTGSEDPCLKADYHEAMSSRDVAIMEDTDARYDTERPSYRHLATEWTHSIETQPYQTVMHDTLQKRIALGKGSWARTPDVMKFKYFGFNAPTLAANPGASIASESQQPDEKAPPVARGSRAALESITESRTPFTPQLPASKSRYLGGLIGATLGATGVLLLAGFLVTASPLGTLVAAWIIALTAGAAVGGLIGTGVQWMLSKPNSGDQTETTAGATAIEDEDDEFVRSSTELKSPHVPNTASKSMNFFENKTEDRKPGSTDDIKSPKL
ncbi:MAG: hypothetical protein ACOYKA_06810 [Legionellaceae bacterium]